MPVLRTEQTVSTNLGGRLAGKVSIITGALGGIGQVAVGRFVAEGAESRGQ